MTTTAPSWDPFAPGYTDDPYPQLAQLREGAAVDAHPIGFYVLWRYDDVNALLRSNLSVDARWLSPGSPMRSLVPDVPDSGARAGTSMLDRDPPDHTRLRRLVSRAFTPRAVLTLEPRIRVLVGSCLDALEAASDPDVVRELAFPLPFAVITEMLGMPRADAHEIRELSGLIVRSLEPVPDPEAAARILEADATLSDRVRDAVTWKRRHRGDDLLTALIDAEHDGDALSEDELIAQVVLLYVAGHETTVNLLAGGTLALLRCPDQSARLRAEPALTDNAVEEMLRYDAPVHMTRRITRAALTVGDVVIPEGSFVVGHLAAANRDPRHFGPDADEFRVDRLSAREHLSFAAGIHHCLGAVLARIEARVAFEGLLDRFPRLALAEEPTWNGRINLRGPQRVRVLL